MWDMFEESLYADIEVDFLCRVVFMMEQISHSMGACRLLLWVAGVSRVALLLVLFWLILNAW